MDALPPALCRSLFLAGTDTGVGKTFVATALLRALVRTGRSAAGMKPVAAGAEPTAQGLRNADALALLAAGNVTLPYDVANPVCLSQPTSPHLAAASAGKSIDIGTIVSAYSEICAQSDVIIVEGAGGWLAPIGPPVHRGDTGPTMQEVALALGLPVVLVVGLRLGCISHALLTAGAIRQSGLVLSGWIANPVDPGFADADRYVDALCERLSEPLLWRMPRR